MELLAPAGSPESLRAAVNAGADAVYIGGRRFGARAYADNPDDEQLLSGMDYCHLHGVKMYLTVNTLMRERELEKELVPFLEPVYRNGLDGVIIQDLGVADIIRREFPGLELHASTQMAIASVSSASFLREKGFCRIVPARELSLQEIGILTRESGMEVEVFVHGALCYCYSGQCLFSSMIGGRSGNRGRCAQPCRLPYTIYGKDHPEEAFRQRNPGNYLLSLKDLCALPLLPELYRENVASLKIEGRMKRPEYTAGVVRIYRKYLDLLGKNGEAGYRIDPSDIRELQDLYSRGGFTEGYFHTGHGPSMMTMLRPNHLGSPAAKVSASSAKAETDLGKGDILEAPFAGNRFADISYTVPSPVNYGESFRPGDAFRSLPAGTVLYRTRNESLLQELSSYVEEHRKKEKIKGVLILFPGKPAILDIEYKDLTVRVEGQEVQMAQSRPLAKEDIEKQILRTGDAPFAFDSLTLRMGDAVFLPVKELNRLRREALKSLEDKILEEYRREKPDVTADIVRPSSVPKTHGNRPLTISVQTKEQLETVLSLAKEDLIFPSGCPDMRIAADLSVWFTDREKTPEQMEEAEKDILRIQKSGFACILVLAPVLREPVREWYRTPKMQTLFSLADGFEIRSLDMAGFLRENGFSFDRTVPDPSGPSMHAGKILVGQEGLYAYNHRAVYALEDAGVSCRVLPSELTAAQMRSLTSGEAGYDSETELTIYGRQLLMVTAQCLRMNTDHCTGHAGFLELKDRKNMCFPVQTRCAECANMIYNSVPLCLFSCSGEIEALDPDRIRISFTDEDKEEIRRVLNTYGSGSNLSDTTRGHFFKGVE